ncbi:MAG: S8 family serine peptidase [Pseudomonadales bacterium]|nr:S8 family serine peptidase [Pseudomonadales bacterium]
MPERNSYVREKSFCAPALIFSEENQVANQKKFQFALKAIAIPALSFGLLGCGADSTSNRGSSNLSSTDVVESTSYSDAGGSDPGGSEIVANEAIEEGVVEASSVELRRMQWTLDNEGEYIHQTNVADETDPVSGMIDVDMNASLAWAVTQGSHDIVVGIVDSGVDYGHPDLIDNLWRNEAELNGEEGVDDDGNGYIDDIYGIDVTVSQFLASGEANPEAGDPLDIHGHGTMAAGVIGAVGDNDIGISGVSPKVSIISCKAFSLLSIYGVIIPNLGAIGPTHDGIIQCMDYFAAMKESGVNIVATNHSYASGKQTYFSGLTFPTEQKYRFDSDELKAAIQRHAELGILFVTGAGNGGLEVNNPYTGRALFKGIDDNDLKGGTRKHTLYPSSFNLPNMISVAGIVNTGELWSGTSFGRYTVDIFAGSDRILSTWPTYMEETFRGEEKPAVATVTYSPAQGYVMAMGTSFAAPQVVGLVALIKSAEKYANLSAVEVKNLILAGGVSLDELCDFREESGRHECLSGIEYAEKSLSGRMIRAADQNGAGALTCSDRYLVRRQLPMLSELQISANTGSVKLEVLNIVCHAGAGEVSARVSYEGGQVEELVLLDDGENTDQWMGDGVYSIEWIAPEDTGQYVIELAGEEVFVTVN